MISTLSLECHFSNYVLQLHGRPRHFYNYGREGGRDRAAGGEESSEILVANRDILGTCSLLIGIILSIYAIISEGRSSLATARFILTSSSIKRRQT